VVHGKKLTIRQSKELKLTGHEVVTKTEGYLRRALETIALSNEDFQPGTLDLALAKGQ
jgi:hypothetical protein